MTEKFVRTKTKASGPLTTEELERMKEHTEMWKARILRTKTVNAEFPKLKAAIEGIYAAANLKKPIVVLVSSPVVMAYAYGAAAAIWENRKNGIADPVFPDKRNPVLDAVALATQRSANPISGSVMSTYSVDAIETSRNACLEIAGEFGIECAKRWNNVTQCGAYNAFDDCYFTAFRDIIGLDLPVFEKYKHWEQAAIYGTYRVMHPNFCIVSDFPEVLKMDDRNLAHCQDGPSHRWTDGYELYHWHGVRVPAEWIKNPSSINPHVALTWKNIEQRRAAIEIVGWAKVLETLNAKVIDKDGDPEIGELLEVEIPDLGKEKFLRVQCGTGRTFALPVPPEMKTAMEANAWTFSLDLNEFVVPEVRT